VRRLIVQNACSKSAMYWLQRLGVLWSHLLCTALCQLSLELLNVMSQASLCAVTFTATLTAAALHCCLVLLHCAGL
jgi:hypothetical protein